MGKENDRGNGGMGVCSTLLYSNIEVTSRLDHTHDIEIPGFLKYLVFLGKPGFYC